MITITIIIKKSTETDIVKELFSEYSKELNENLCFQNFDEELEDPLQKYGEPNGCLLLAYDNGKPAGCIALKPLLEGVCEMKRLYVRPQYRNKGIGDELIKVLVEKAKEKGFTKMVLDTLERLTSAQKLYLKHGFKNTSAYYKNPLKNVVYMEKEL